MIRSPIRRPQLPARQGTRRARCPVRGEWGHIYCAGSPRSADLGGRDLVSDRLVCLALRSCSSDQGATGDTGSVVTQEGRPDGSGSADEPLTDRDQLLADRFKRLPPAIPIATTVALVGAVPTVPVGPEGAAGGGDGD